VGRSHLADRRRRVPWALRVSSRSRPALAALLLAGLAAHFPGADARRAALARVRHRADRSAPFLAALAALAVALTSVVFGELVASGADSSGYLHQAQLWVEGRGTLVAPVLDNAPWPLAGWEVAPLGFAPSTTPGLLGPTYAPGLPWLMALGGALAGAPGRFLWTPLAAGLLVWFTFVLARREAPPAAALGAALVVATSPPVLFAATQTMSDLAGAALWVGAVIASAPWRGRVVAAGLGAAPCGRIRAGRGRRLTAAVLTAERPRREGAARRAAGRRSPRPR
jgi:hypothetical protein